MLRTAVWTGGILVAAVVVAFVLLSRGKDQLAVHLVDANKKSVRASVIVQETRRYPILRSMKFLPEWARASTRSNHVDVIDGIVKVRRVKAPGNETILAIMAKMERSFVVFISGETNGASYHRWPPGRDATRNEKNFIIDPGPKGRI